MTKTLKTFIIYSRKDKATLEELKAQLKPLEYSKQISVWYDGEIVAGEKWDTMIKNRLKEAELILMLISRNFFTSSYIETVELQHALDQHAKGKSIVVPIIVRSCVWEGYFDIGQFQALPVNGRPIHSREWYDVDEAMANVVRGIMKIIKKFKGNELSESESINSLVQPSNNEHLNIEQQKVTVTASKADRLPEEEWEFIQLLKGQSGYEQCLKDFVRDHPESAFHLEAKKILEEFEKSRKIVAQKQQLNNTKDEAAWRIAKKVNTIPSYKTYISNFANGVYFKDAWQILKGFHVPEMIRVGQGSFWNSVSNKKIEVPEFYISKYLVTFETYDAYCEAISKEKPSDAKHGRKNRPVINVSWYDTIEFCNWLSQQHFLQPVYLIDKNKLDSKNSNKNDSLKWSISRNHNANGYRLPTEIEWEFAAKGGTRSKGFKYAGSDKIDNIGWTQDNSNKQSHPVGRKQPNELGIYDMSGNVSEWCWDWYGKPLGYRTSDRLAKGSQRITRGGSYGNTDYRCRIIHREESRNPANSSVYNGFRLAQSFFRKSIE